MNLNYYPINVTDNYEIFTLRASQVSSANPHCTREAVFTLNL